MKKIFLVLLLLIPISVNALNINVNGEVKENQEIQGSSVVLGNYVENTSKVSGLDMTLGNTIKYEGESEYLLSAGNNIEINGTVKNDGFVFGNVVNFNENSVIERDLLVLANNVTISGTIKKDVTIYASTVTINGNIENVNVKANEIIIENANINNLSYNEDAVIEIKDSEVNTTNLTEKLQSEVTIQDQIMNFIYNLGGILVIFLALYLLAPKLFKKIENNNANITVLNVFSMFGFGTLSLILIPVIFILLLTIVFCMPLAILLLILYVLAIWLSSIFTGYLLGYVILTKLIKKENNPLLIGLIGIVILNLLGVIPYIGILITVISVMIGMGIILQQFKRNE